MFRKILFIVVFCLFGSEVLAVGISGNNLNIYSTFVPSSVYEFSYILVSDETRTNDYDVYATKDFAEFVTLERTKFEKIPPKSNLPISGKIVFPEEVDVPGWHYLQICVVEACPSGAQICGRGGACASLNFMVLYPGIMPLLNLHAGNIGPDEPLNLLAKVENIGKDDINKASGYVDIFDIEGKKVGSAILESKAVSSGSKEVLNGVFQTNGLLSGNYSATAFVDFDGTKKESNASFRIGTLNVNIVDYDKEIEAGGIKKFKTKIESMWNDPLLVFGEVSIYDYNSSAYSKTASVVLTPWSFNDLEAFIDTSKLVEKEYDLKIEIFYGEKKSTVNDKIKITEPKSEDSDEKDMIKEEPKSNMVNITIILVIFVILLTVINIALVLMRRKKE